MNCRFSCMSVAIFLFSIPSAFPCQQPVCTTRSVCDNNTHLGGPQCHDIESCTPGTCGADSDFSGAQPNVQLNIQLNTQEKEITLPNGAVSRNTDGLNISDDTGRVKTGTTCVHSVAGPFCTDTYEGGVIYWLSPTDKVSQAQLDALEGRTAELTGEAIGLGDPNENWYGYNSVILKVESVSIR